jgi:WD40 repeat protein
MLKMNIKKKSSCLYYHEICCDNFSFKEHKEVLIKEYVSSELSYTLFKQENKNENFYCNELNESLIKTEFQKSKLDTKDEIKSDSSKNKIENFKKDPRDPKNIIYNDEFSELKKELNFKRDNLKIQIDKTVDDLIQELELFESDGLNRNINLERYNDLVNSSKKLSDELERRLSLFTVESKWKIANELKTKKEFKANLKKELNGHSSLCAAIVLEKGELAIGSVEGIIKIWDVNDGTVKKTLKGHSAWIRDLKRAQKYLISASDDKIIKI